MRYELTMVLSSCAPSVCSVHAHVRLQRQKHTVLSTGRQILYVFSFKDVMVLIGELQSEYPQRYGT